MLTLELTDETVTVTLAAVNDLLHKLEKKLAAGNHNKFIKQQYDAANQVYEALSNHYIKLPHP